MRRFVRTAAMAVGLASASAAAAGTVILLPAPGSMSPARIVSDGTDSGRVYLCTAPTDLHRGHCTVQKGASVHRR